MTELACSLALWALVQSTCLEFDLPPEAVYSLILAESQGDPNAIGDHGKAIGLAQFHQSTFTWLAEKYELPAMWPDDALDAANAVRVLCAALADGRGHLWHGWRRMSFQLVPGRSHRMWAKATKAQLDALGVR